MTIDRRALAKGTLWSVPLIVVAAPAPAAAASPCAVYRTGQPLPASAFTATYARNTGETLGGAANKQLGLDFGFKMSDEALACGVTSGSIRSTNEGGISRVKLQDGSRHDATNGGSVPASGSVGVVDTSCQSGLNGTQACGTSGQSAFDVKDSSNTNALYVTGVSIYRSITVTGFGATTVYLNATFPAAGRAPRSGTDLSMTAAPIF